MRFFATVAVLSSITASTAVMAVNPRDGYGSSDPCVLADSPALNASMQLANWAECATSSLFPYPGNPAWPQGAAEHYTKDVRYTFNNTHYNYDNIFKLYTSFNATIGAQFSTFSHGVTNKLAVPNSNGDKGGMAYLLGWEGGYLPSIKQEVYFTNAAFVRVEEVNGKRMIAELRESSNIPNYAPEPPADPWGCGE